MCGTGSHVDILHGSFRQETIQAAARGCDHCVAAFKQHPAAQQLSWAIDKRSPTVPTPLRAASNSLHCCSRGTRMTQWS